MNSLLNRVLKEIGIFNILKILKDKYFENPVHSEYRNRLLKFYSEFINQNDLCFDIGASYGNRTETFLKLGAKVISVEPQTEVAKYLEMKFGRKINLINKAVGAKEEIKPMFLSNDSAISSLSKEWITEVSNSMRFGNKKWRKQININVTTLDNLINEFGIPDFCKIDVEGYEFEVLMGLSKAVKRLSFEFTIPEFEEQAIKCILHLASLGQIVCNYSSGESLKLSMDFWQTPEKFIELLKTFHKQNIIDGDIYVEFI